MRLKALIVFGVVFVIFWLVSNTNGVAAHQNQISYNRDIRPIFSDTCFRCHGPDKNARKAGLRLDVRDEALRKTKSGVVPIVPGKPDDSEIVRRIFSMDQNELMPPPEVHKTLTPQQKETIKLWVAQGAIYEGHWSYQPVHRPEIPDAKIHPIDFFIQQRLQKAGLQLAPEADRRTLIRRVSLDLTGIPPTSQEVAAFVNDKTPDAYEKLVDRLLASPRYAEKQAMHWLDAVRYADTSGFHGDNAWPAWPYRDYVLRAFRDNKPFDVFTREQLAGDLMPNASEEQKIASAYNRMNRTSAEGGLQPKEYLAKYAADRVRTTSIVWLGATMGCAECHDHKFDPILTKDFYAMEAFFADVKETGLVPDRGRDAFGAKLMLTSGEQKQRYDELTAKLTQARKELETKAASFDARRPAWEKETVKLQAAGKLDWKLQRILSAQAKNGTTLQIYNDETINTTRYLSGNILNETIKGEGLVVASGALPEQEIYTVTFKPGAGAWTQIGLDVAQDESLPALRVGRSGDRFVVTEFEAEISEGQGTPRKLNFSLATTDGTGQPPEHPAIAAIDGNPKTGWGVTYGDNRDMFLALRFAQKLQTSANSLITVRVRQESAYRKAVIGRFRIALSDAEYAWPDHLIKTDKALRGVPTDFLKSVFVAENKRNDEQQKNVNSFFQWSVPELEPLLINLAKIEAERDSIDAQIPRVIITETMMPRDTRILPRGNFLDESGELLQPAIPQFFGKVDTTEKRATRLDLANWITSKNNPLTARVYVNRLWREFFGVGLSKTLDDLGSQGEWPTHPELLDWLASEFMQPKYCGVGIADCGLKKEGNTLLHDWDVKHLIRLIVTSHTYKQSSIPATENPQSQIRNPQSDDPDNRLLARQHRPRVDAEIVRDIALSVSGLLVEKFGGSSVKPYQPDGYLAALNFPKRDYATDRGENLYRRGLYTHWQRTFLHPSLMTFDAPSREECTVNRTNSNTPLQALVLLNDPIYVEAARVFAQNILRQGGKSVAAQIDWAFERTLNRPATAEEKNILIVLHRKNLLRFQRDTAGAKNLVNVGESALPKDLSVVRLAAMTTVTRALLNLHETITRN